MSSGTPGDVRGTVNSVVTMVTFRSRDTLPGVLPALTEWLASTPDGAVVVVENDGDAATVGLVLKALGSHPDRVRAVVAESNAGFAPAMNAARRTARESWGEPSAVLLLNPDVITDAATIAGVFECVRRPGIGIASPLLVDDDERVDRGSARRFWNLRRLFAEVVGAPSLAGLLGSPLRSIEVVPGREPTDVEITSGAFLAVRVEILAGGLDTRLPMYLEDQEICHRAHLAGWRVVVDTRLRARHIGGVSRSADSGRTRELRMMELATAPALALLDVSPQPVSRVRRIVALGGAIRILVATVALIPSLPFARRRQWALSQIRLGSWFVRWAGDPRALDSVTWETP